MQGVTDGTIIRFSINPTPEQLARVQATRGTVVGIHDIEFVPHRDGLLFLATRDDGMKFYIECPHPLGIGKLDDSQRASLCGFLNNAFASMDFNMRCAPRAATKEEAFAATAREFKEGLTS